MPRRFPSTQGFGYDGLAVGPAGYVFRFSEQPVKRIKVMNTGDADCYVGINADIDESETNEVPDHELHWPADMIEGLSPAAALAKSVLLAAGDEHVFEAEEVETGARLIYTFWALTPPLEEGESVPFATTLHGGALGI